MTTRGLFDAVYALREFAAGKTPDRARLQCGALSLSTEKLNGTTDRDLLDAAAILDAEATGRHIDADQAAEIALYILLGLCRTSQNSENNGIKPILFSDGLTEDEPGTCCRQAQSLAIRLERISVLDLSACATISRRS